LDPQKVALIRNGVALPPPQISRSAWREQLGVKDDTLLAVMVANLSAFKDQEGLLRAWGLVRKSLTRQDKDVRLLLAGKDFGTGAKLRELSSKLGIENDVLFLGQVRDVSGLLAAVDLCVFSSPSEGCPNGILEAMSGGLAVAAVDNEGIREAVGEHQYPWLSAVGDDEAFAQNILALIQDDALRATLGEQNRRRIQNEFLFDKMCRETEALVLGFPASRTVDV
jgi:glycosyltransferase involved in cell wall biosynthesis